jgi:hypothetical protein
MESVAVRNLVMRVAAAWQVHQVIGLVDLEQVAWCSQAIFVLAAAIWSGVVTADGDEAIRVDGLRCRSWGEEEIDFSFYLSVQEQCQACRRHT